MDILKLAKKQKEELKSEYKSKVSALNKLIDAFEEPTNGISDTERTKRILSEHTDKAYQINEYMDLLELEGVQVTRSVLHQALKQLREAGQIVAFRLNGSNQSVYYMTPEGRDDSQELYPVAPDFRPTDESYVDKFEWLDEE